MTSSTPITLYSSFYEFSLSLVLEPNFLINAFVPLMLKFNTCVQSRLTLTLSKGILLTCPPGCLFLYLYHVLSCNKRSIYEATLWTGSGCKLVVFFLLCWFLVGFSESVGCRVTWTLVQHKGWGSTGARTSSQEQGVEWSDLPLPFAVPVYAVLKCRLSHGYSGLPGVWFVEAFTITSEFLGRCASLKRRAIPC